VSKSAAHSKGEGGRHSDGQSGKKQFHLHLSLLYRW
jgi:hypothetical protein